MARSRSSSSSRGGLLDNVANLFMIGVVVVVGWLAWPSLVTEFSARTTFAPGMAQPTPASASAPRPAVLPYQAAAPATPNVQQAIDQYNAAQQATAAALAAPVPNVDATGDSAPLIVVAKPADRQPAPAVVPTAEPVGAAQSSDAFGSKPIVVNPQQTHECRHAQVWTDAGCKNPTPVQ